MFNWENIRVVIFDVDGTLYEQSKLRKRMLFSLLGYYSLRPWRLKELRMLQLFRAEREKMAGFDGNDLETAQYQWCARKGSYRTEDIKQVVDFWMFRFPNKFLPQCIYPGVASLFKTLKGKGYKVAIYSDYSANDKLSALSLEADLVVASTDTHISKLKPHPKALYYIANYFNVRPDQCLFIGDREELDGLCAANAGMPYVILDKRTPRPFNFYNQLEEQVLSSA